MCYKLDGILSSTNRINFVFVQSKFGLYDRFVILINCPFISSGIMTLEVLSMSCFSGVVYVGFLYSFIVLIFLLLRVIL